MSQTVLVGSDQHVILVRHGDNVVPSGNTVGIVETTDDIVVQRVVGQIRIIGDDDVTGTLGMRIRVALYDDTSDTVSFYADSLFDGADANEPFLWQRYATIVNGTDSWETVMNPWWSTLDVRVARRLARDQALVLSLQAATAGFSLRCIPYLRSWARMAG